MPIDVGDFERGEAPGTAKKKSKQPKPRKEAIPNYGLKPPREREVKLPKVCSWAGCNTLTVNKCLYCGGFFCDEHVHTEKHNCTEHKKTR